VTNDRKLSAQFEHPVAVTRNSIDVLTLRRDETPMLDAPPIR
jgi:methionyl aminopeptidase